MITAKVLLTKPLRAERQFIATTGSEHHMPLDDAAGGIGPKPIELVAVGLAGCTAFDVITILRQKYHHVVTGQEIDPAAIEEDIRVSEQKYCFVAAMVQQTANLHTTYKIVEEKTKWLTPSLATAGA